MRIIKSLWFLTVFTFVTGYYYSFILIHKFLGLFTRKKFPEDSAHMLAVKWGQSFLKGIPGWNIDLTGEENIPRDGAFVIVANHESGTDILAIYFLGIQFRWLSKKTVFNIPMVGGAMKACGYVPIIRGDKSSQAEAIQKSEDILRAGTPMLFFPEGTRSTKGTPGDFKTGAFRLAQKCGVPVLPVVLQGAGNLLKKKSICPMPATVNLKVLPLMHSKAGEDGRAFADRVRSEIVKSHKKILSSLKKNDNLISDRDLVLEKT